MEEHNIVILVEDIPNVKSGTLGTIVYAYARNNMFEVEFVNGFTVTIKGDKVKVVNL